MTCDLFDKPCEDCELEYCPDTIETLNMEYVDMIEDVLLAQKNLEWVETELEHFYEEHKEILIKIQQ